MIVDRLLATGLLPDRLIRSAIRRAVRERLACEDPGTDTGRREKLDTFVQMLSDSPVAVNTDEANGQHYEVPSDFFRLVLGPHLKYSCALWADGVTSLAEAEQAMLALTCQRAGIEDGQRILELGCGWGSLSLWMASRYPGSTIVAVSNSSSQKRYIDERASAEGVNNLEVLTADMRHLQLDSQFNRVVSVEMFEHMRNWAELMRRIAGWLTPAGELFVHVFSHARLPYLFEDQGASDWMARHFFTGGQMPSDDLLPRFQDDLYLANHWTLDGIHYQKTARAWLDNMDRNRKAIQVIFRRTYGAESARFFAYWRVFFMACEEVWGYHGGLEWLVSHYRFTKSA